MFATPTFDKVWFWHEADIFQWRQYNENEKGEEACGHSPPVLLL